MKKYWQILTENLKGKAVIVNDQADISFCGKSTGSMMNVTNVLTEAHVNIRAISTFDTPEFGIMRLVVDDPVRAKESLNVKRVCKSRQ